MASANRPAWGRRLLVSVGALTMLVVAAPPSLAAPGDVPLLLRPGARAAAPPTAAARWTWPLPDHPRVTRGFDPPATLYGPGHRGVDLAGYAGEPVLAAGPGVVGFAGLVAGWGVVTVRHPGGLKTTYEPVRPIVRAGQPVTVGARVGRLDDGHPGCPVPACLHWGLLRGDAYLDPLLLLGRVRLRLLPLGTGPT